MFQRLTIYRIAFANILVALLLLLLWKTSLVILLTKIFACLLNASFLIISLSNLPRFLRRNGERLFIGRKRTLIVLMSSVYIGILLYSTYYNLSVRDFSIMYVSWTILMFVVRFFVNQISAFLHTVFKKGRRIAIVGYDDNAHKLAEKLRKKSSNYFINHIDTENEVAQSRTQSLSNYIEFAKKNHISEFYISVPEHEESSIAVLAEEAERHCIRVNFIAQQQQENLESGFYHIHYIGGLPVLKRYREPLKRLHKQVLKRAFDILVSSIVILFILSWLIPLISLLVKLESKGPVFFKQLRSGRNNNSFNCLKFRSMHDNDFSDTEQATKYDKRITKVGAFLRKTSLDEFPQFLNVFIGDMSVVGPRPHMLHHTEQYSEQVNHYMVRLYLKPGLTGWAQVNGYRGEIKNIELLKSRVDHDIWYMENWSILLDVKIMFLTFMSIITGDENAY